MIASVSKESENERCVIVCASKNFTKVYSNSLRGSSGIGEGGGGRVGRAKDFYRCTGKGLRDKRGIAGTRLHQDVDRFRRRRNLWKGRRNG